MIRYLFALLLIAGLAQADTYRFIYKIGAPIDSVRFYHDTNGVDAGRWLGTGQSEDTLITYTADRYHQIYAYIWYQGSDSIQSDEIQAFGVWRGTTWRIHPHWQDETDTTTGLLIRDGIAIDTFGRGSEQSYDTAFTVELNRLYKAVFSISYPGDSPITVSYQVNTDTAVIIETVPSPSDTFHTMVWGHTRTGGSDTVGFADITFTMARQANNACDSTIIVDPTRKTRSDANGYFQVELLRSSCLLVGGARNDSVRYQSKWVGRIKKGANQVEIPAFLVPDTGSSYHLVW